jgi:protein-arginine kinase activator protein McsA
MENENIHKNLITLLKMFKNRPYHLSKYLLDNDAFNQEFIDKIKNSSKLSSMNTDISNYFSSITEMEQFYNSLIEESRLPVKVSKKSLSITLSEKLQQLIDNEKYEEAAALRDYMLANGIKKINHK